MMTFTLIFKVQSMSEMESMSSNIGQHLNLFQILKFPLTFRKLAKLKI